MISDQSVHWIGLLAFSMLGGFGLYVLNVQSFRADSDESLVCLLSGQTLNGVRLWAFFYCVGWVLMLGVLALSGVGW